MNHEVDQIPSEAMTTGARWLVARFSWRIAASRHCLSRSGRLSPALRPR